MFSSGFNYPCKALILMIYVFVPYTNSLNCSIKSFPVKRINGTLTQPIFTFISDKTCPKGKQQLQFIFQTNDCQLIKNQSFECLG